MQCTKLQTKANNSGIQDHVGQRLVRITTSGTPLVQHKIYTKWPACTFQLCNSYHHVSHTNINLLRTILVNHKTPTMQR